MEQVSLCLIQVLWLEEWTTILKKLIQAPMVFYKLFVSCLFVLVVPYLVVVLVGNVTPVNVVERHKSADHWTKVCFLCSFFIPSWFVSFLFLCHSHSSLFMSIKAQEFSGSSSSVNLHAQATSFARLSETVNNGKTHTLSSDSGLSPVLPVSAEMAKLLPHRKGGILLFRNVVDHNFRNWSCSLARLSFKGMKLYPNSFGLQRVQEDLI